jgi:hypothetical protein
MPEKYMAEDDDFRGIGCQRNMMSEKYDVREL